MPKPPTKFDHISMLRSLGDIYDSLSEKHGVEQRAIGNRIPVGGGDWMDLFFKMEGIRGVMTALRLGKTLDWSIKFGCDTSSIAVKIWNTRRGYQVSRWEKTARDFVERSVYRLLEEQRSSNGTGRV